MPPIMMGGITNHSVLSAALGVNQDISEIIRAGRNRRKPMLPNTIPTCKSEHWSEINRNSSLFKRKSAPASKRRDNVYAVCHEPGSIRLSLSI